MDLRNITSKAMQEELMFWKNAMRLNTCIPAIIDEFDVATQRVSAIPAIKAKYISPELEVEYIDYPKITNIPLAIQKTSGLKITVPVKKGDNCTLIFSQRSIDNFLLDGTRVAKPFEGDVGYTSSIRCMDLTDAMCFPGIICNNETIPNYSNEAIEIRNSDGSTKVSVSENSLNFVQGSASIAISNGNVNITGSHIYMNGTDWATHKHTGVSSGSSKTGGVTA